MMIIFADKSEVNLLSFQCKTEGPVVWKAQATGMSALQFHKLSTQRFGLF